MESINVKEKTSYLYFSFKVQIAFKIDPRSTWKAIGGDKRDHFSDIQQNMQRC